MPTDTTIPTILTDKPKNPFPFPITIPASSPITSSPTQSVVGTPVGSAIGGGTIYRRPDGSTYVAPISPSESLGTGGYTPPLSNGSGGTSGGSSGSGGYHRGPSSSPGNNPIQPTSSNEFIDKIQSTAPLAASQPYNPVGEAISNSYYGINDKPPTQSESDKYSISNVNFKGGFNKNGEIYLSDYINYKFAKGANYVTDAWASILPKSNAKNLFLENKHPFSVWHLGVGTAFAPSFSTGSDSLFRSIRAGDIIPESNTKIIAVVKNAGEGVSRVDVIGTTESMGKTSSGVSSQFIKDIENGKSVSVGKGVSLLTSGKTTQATEYGVVGKNFNSKVLEIKDYGKLVVAKPANDISSVSSVSLSRDIASIKSVPDNVGGFSFGSKIVKVKVNPSIIKNRDTFGLFKNLDHQGNIIAYRGTSNPIKYPSGFGANKGDFDIQGYILRSPSSSETASSGNVANVLKLTRSDLKSVQEQSAKIATSASKSIVKSLPTFKSTSALPSASALTEPKVHQSSYYGTGQYELTNQEILSGKSNPLLSQTQSQSQSAVRKFMSTNKFQKPETMKPPQPIFPGSSSISEPNFRNLVPSRTITETKSKTTQTPKTTPKQIETITPTPPWPPGVIPNPPRFELPPLLPPKIKLSFDESLSSRRYGAFGARKYFPSYDAIIKNIRGKKPTSAITNALGTRPITSKRLFPTKSKFRSKKV